MNRILKTLFIIFCMALVFSCGQQSGTVANFVPPNIDLPLKEEIIKYADFTINPQEGGSFRTERGTFVTVPASAFVFEDGSKVTDLVHIKFREYHSASDILLSGIRMMAKTESGEILPFESAGMFDIDGTCGNKKIQIAQGKAIDIFLPNKHADADFNFYILDESKGWVEIQKNLPVVGNPIPEETKKQAEQKLPEQPVEPEKFDNSSFVFDLDMDTYQHPELKELYGIMWQYDGEKGADTDPEKNKKITATNWTHSEIIRSIENKYTLSLKSRKEAMLIPVKPVLSGKNYAEAKARYDKKINNYNNAVAQKEAAIKVMEVQAEYARQLSVSGFGIYNCDRYYKMPNVATVQEPLFTVNSQTLPSGTALFHIAKDNVVIRLYDTKQPFTYGSNEKNRIIAVLPDQTIAALSGSEFRSAVSASGSVIFNLKQLPLGQISPEKLNEVISNI